MAFHCSWRKFFFIPLFCRLLRVNHPHMLNLNPESTYFYSAIRIYFFLLLALIFAGNPAYAITAAEVYSACQTELARYPVGNGYYCKYFDAGINGGSYAIANDASPGYYWWKNGFDEPNSCSNDLTLDPVIGVCGCSSGQVLVNGVCFTAPSCTTSSCTEINPTTVNPLKNTGQPSLDTCAGNPFNIGTGNKYQLETDYQGTGEFPLAFERAYNSDASTHSERFGPASGWRHSYERSIIFTTNSNLAVAYRPDGKAFTFSLVDNHWLPVVDVNLQLIHNTLPSGWTLTTEDDRVETYDANGKLQSIKSPAGTTHTLTYDANGLLTTVTHSNGRSLTLSYDSAKRVVTVQDPAGGLYQYGYNAATGNLETVTYPDLSKKAYLYNETGKVPSGINLPHALTGIIDENGHRFASWTYDAQGRAISSQHAGGAESVTISYGSNNTTVTDALGTARTNSLQIIQGVAKSGGQSQPAGAGCAASASNISYDTNGNLTSSTDFNGNLSCYAYDLSRNLETVRLEGLSPGSSCPADLAAYTPTASSDERKISTQWHANYRLPIQIDEAGRRISFSYDANGNPLQSTVTDTATNQSRSWTYTYNDIGQVLSEDGPRTDINDTTSYSYYGDSTADHKPSDLWKITNALGHVTTFTAYDANGRLLSLTDPNGLAVDFAYDPRGRLTQKAVNGNTTRYDYDPAGNLIKLTRPSGVFITYSYDAARRLTDVTDALGNKIHYTLDLMGNRIKEEIVAADGSVVKTHSRQFDALSRLQQDIDAYNQTSSYQHDANGNLTQITDANGHTTQIAYDSLDRLIRTTDAVTGLTEYQYDSQDRITQVTDAKYHRTTYNYNGLGDLIQLDSPNTGITQYSYDSAGNLAQKTDSGNITARYNYDALNRLLGADYPGTEADTAYRYDTTRDNQTGQTGRITEAKRGYIVTQLYHDLRGNQTANSVRNGATNQIISDTHYDFDADGRLTKIKPTATTHVQYHYDIAGQIQRIDLVDANGITILADTIRHLPFGPVQLLRYGNGLELHRSYDQDYRLTQETVGTIHHLNYGYQADGQLTQIVDSVNDSQQTFDYDPLHRLSSVTASQQTSQNQEYIYDPVGNRTELHTGKTSTRYDYAFDSQMLTGISVDHRKPTSYISNPQGNIDQIGTLALKYSADQRLSNVTQIKNKKHGRELARYQYDAQGQRVAKIAAKGTTYYIYDLDQRLLGEDAGNPSHYVYLDGQPLARIDGAGDTAKLYFFHNNQIGAPLKVTDQAAQVAWTAELDPFGQATTVNPNIVQNLRFPGQYYDKETGWHYNMQRYYDPALGRYLQSDPIGLMGGVNTYAYVGNNPLIYTDPYGLWAWGDPLNQSFVNTSAGFGDAVSSFATLGIYSTADIRNSLDISGGVNQCSASYTSGKFAGYAWGAGTLWAAGLSGGANSVFWSGYNQGARGIAESLGGTTLESTPIGRALDFASNTLNIPGLSPVWRAASATFAANASGTATAVVLSESATSVWATTELPILTARGIPIIFH